MTNAEINVAIAEACGWVFHEGEEPRYGGTYKRRGWSNGKKWRINPPSYCTDLNEMHKVEKTILKSYWGNYSAHLSYITRNGSELDNLETYKKIHASARQRAEAFLRTIGKWKYA